MLSFLKYNKKLILIFTILLVIIPIFGFNFLIGILGNILLLIILIPLLILLITFLGFNLLLKEVKEDKEEIFTEASEKTIEVEAEEIK